MAEKYSGITQSCGHQSQRNKTGGEGRGEDQKKLWLREKENRVEKQSSKFKGAERKVT